MNGYGIRKVEERSLETVDGGAVGVLKSERQMSEKKKDYKVTCSLGSSSFVNCLSCLFWRFVYFGVS
jgi:hypothetical protein